MKPRILLVEDDETLCSHLAERLADEYEVECAHDGGQALRAIMRRQPDLVIADIVMPGVDGIELLKTLRSTPGSQTLPVVLISGHAPDELRIAGFEHGADDYLAKPYTERELRARIKSVLLTAQLRIDTARQKALEEAQQEARNERAAILESITDPFYALDPDWQFTFINQRACDYYGKSRDELLGQVIWDALPVTLGTDFETQLRLAARERQSIAFETLSPVTQHWVEVHAYPMPRGLAVNFRDISRRKQSELLLRQAEERYRAFVANSSEGIWRYELDEPLDVTLSADDQLDHLYRHAHLAELNDAMASMYGHQHASELLGTPLAATLPVTDPAVQDYLRRVIAAGFRITNAESAERDRGGNVRYFVNSMVPVFEHGRLVRVWGVQRDITARKLAEERLKVADRRKNEFLALLAHELRNPLASIRNGLHILRLLAPTDPHAQRSVTMMDRQVTHLVRLVEDLMDVSRIARGKLSVRCEPVQLAEVLASALEGARGMLEAKGHEITVEILDEGLMVEGDVSRLTQVFSNLLLNSAKYTDPQGRVSMALEREGDEAVVTVSDNGIGIPPQDLDKVFELFSQVRAHQGRADGGLGIGLSLVRRLVQMHRGSVTAESAGHGAGSTFKVRLPLASQRSPAEAHGGLQPAAVTRTGVGAQRILVVDDDADAAESLAMLLASLGHQTRVAPDGEQAARLVQEFAPQVIFMDLGMPHMDGCEATRRIRQQPNAERIHIIALTGWAQDADRVRCQAAGMNGYLVKPPSAEALQAALDGINRSAALGVLPFRRSSGRPGR